VTGKESGNDEILQEFAALPTENPAVFIRRGFLSL